MDNLEYLKMRKETDERKPVIEFLRDIEYRKALALEIIAETLINIDDKLTAIKVLNTKSTNVHVNYEI